MRFLIAAHALTWSIILGVSNAHALPQESVAPGLACANRGAIDSNLTLPVSQEGWNISGWAYDVQGVTSIRFISSSGELLTTVNPKIPRPDVSAVLTKCPRTMNAGFSASIPVSIPKQALSSIRVEALTATGKSFPVGTISTPFTTPVGFLDEASLISVNARNIISGWAFQLHDDPVLIRILAKDKEIGRVKAGAVRKDVAGLFSAWPSALKSGFEFPVSFKNLPRGRYFLKIVLEGRNGSRVVTGPEVINDLPVGMVLAVNDRMTNPENVSFRAWGYDEDGMGVADVQTEDGLALGRMKLEGKNVTLSNFEYGKSSGVKEHWPPGSAYGAHLALGSLPDGIHRLVVRISDMRGNETVLPGPIVFKEPPSTKTCNGQVRHIFLPGGDEVFRLGFPQLKTLREFSGGCIDAGMRGRVEYLRTTLGRTQDFQFDPDFLEKLRKRNGQEMTGESLNSLLDTALKLRSSLMITLDGGVWADAKFSAPDIDAVDFLEEDERSVQWNQFNKSEPDTALQGLAGSIADPQLARMMSLNRFNNRFLSYKKRNLQAAIRHISAFMKKHPDIHVAINFDPDNYINPWFYLKQWYDYNPDAIRQFREWLFHKGPYADGGHLAAVRHEPAISLAKLNRIAHTNFRSEDEVDPPRAYPDYDSQWHQIWTQFKRHLVAQHYEDLTAWAIDAGMPSERIYTSQTFIQTDVSVQFRDRANGWTDEAGVSIRGAKPGKGHLGAILYGPASRNEGRSRNSISLIDNIRLIDSAWGSGEFHPATIEFPERMPSHEASYQTMITMLNGGARFLSPMWGSHARDQLVHPERFRSYDVFDGSPFEYQFLWWIKTLRTLPMQSLFFPFGNQLVASDDGWQAGALTRMKINKGFLLLEGKKILLKSPRWHGVRSNSRVTVGIQGRWPGQSICATLRVSQKLLESCTKASTDEAEHGTGVNISFPAKGEIQQLDVQWKNKGGVVPIRLDDVRIEIK